MAKLVRSCPECGAQFTQHRWAPADEEFLVGNDHAVLVDGKQMTVKCRNGHKFQVAQWIRKRSKGHEYELGDQL